MPSLIATLSMMQTLLLSALSVARERQLGTFDQLLVNNLYPDAYYDLEGHSADYYWSYSIFHYFGDYSVLVSDPDEWLFDLTLFWIICL